MDIRVGPSFFLSILIAVAAAVALNRPLARFERPMTSAPGPSAPVAREVAPDPVVAAPVELTPPKADPVVMPKAVVETSRPEEKPAERAVVETRKLVRITPKRSPPGRPRGAFTTVEAGESLADVATRVYQKDSAEVVRSLWLANRDQLKSDNDPPSAGMVLRTP